MKQGLITKKDRRTRRHLRIRSKISGTSLKPRLSVFKSNKFTYAQIIDDDAGKTLVSLSTKSIKGKNELERASQLGHDLAQLAKGKKINEVVFDRSGYIYTGKISALAEGARKGGLKF